MKLPWHKPPPPPEFEKPPFQSGLLLGTVLFLLALQYLGAILRSLRQPGSSVALLNKDNSYLCMPCYTGVLLLFHLALIGAGYELQSPLPAGLPATNPLLFLYMVSPVVGFGLLLFSEFLSWLFTSVLGPARRYAYFRHPIMAVHASTLLFYVLSYSQGAVALQDRFGRPLYPVRYVHWFLSVSSLGQSVYMLLVNLPNSPHWLSDVLMRYMLAVPMCFVSGFVASYSDALLLSMACLAISFAAFWYMLTLMLRMLRVGELASVATGNAPQFVAIRITITIVWHGFTVVWLLAAADYITPLTEHALYIACDFMAKYLILFVSIASIN